MRLAELIPHRIRRDDSNAPTLVYEALQNHTADRIGTRHQKGFWLDAPRDELHLVAALCEEIEARGWQWAMEGGPDAASIGANVYPPDDDIGHPMTARRPAVALALAFIAALENP